MRLPKSAILAIALTGSTVVGGAVGATLFAAAPSGAATTTPTASSSTAPAAGAPTGTFRSNEDPTHEAGESAAREAQGNAGQVPTVP